jgi:hypothetical protein
MEDLELVYFLKSFCNLTDKVSRFLLCKGVLDLSQVVQISTFTELHEEVEVVRCLLNVIECDDIWAVDHGKDSDFSFKVLMQLIVQVLLLNNFAGDLGVHF